MPETQDEPVDALDTLTVQDALIADLLATWREATDKLREGDDVDTRWERGSAAKLLLQHFAVRESAKQAVADALAGAGHDELAERVEGDGVGRRTAMDEVDKEVRGRQAMALNNPGIDGAMTHLAGYFDREHRAEVDEVVPAVREVLGSPGERDLPSARTVRMTSTTHPSPEPRWFDKVTPLKAVRAFYQHLRGTPTGGTSPGVDGGREHTPGVHP